MENPGSIEDIKESMVALIPPHPHTIITTVDIKSFFHLEDIRYQLGIRPILPPAYY